MDFSVLPTISALTVFICCFRPLVRRAGPQTNVWFTGWAFLLLHYIALIPPSPDGWLDHALTLTSIWSTELCGMCFMLAACDAGISPSCKVLIIKLSPGVLLQSFLYTFQWNASGPRLIAAALMLIPAIDALRSNRDSKGPLQDVSWGIAAVACLVACFSWSDPYIALTIAHAMLFLSAAYLTLRSAESVTRGIAVMVAGLTIWAVSYILQAVNVLNRDFGLHRALLDIPRYAVAGGLILWLLDEYLDRAENLALHDPLTGLPNRRHFDNRMDEALAESASTGVPLACLVIDVDKFKYINDTFGHHVGDGLLHALAKRLSWNLGPRDMLARTGGDEFTAILVEAGDESHVRFIAGAMMAAGCVPILIGEQLIDVRLSIGIALSPRDASTRAELHRIADEAMYRAKRRGGSGIALTYEGVEQT